MVGRVAARRSRKIGQIGDASAAIEAVVPLARVARQMLGADAVEGAVEPGLHVAEQDRNGGDMVGRRFAWSTQTWRLPRSAPRAARWCGPNRWRRSTSRAASITSAPSRNSKTR